MLRNLLSVGGMTLLSRITGFARDVMLGAMLGAGVAADAFYIAFRLPNHFRAIFGEGAFNAAYVPSYSRVLETEGREPARTFASRIFTLLLASQVLLLALAWAFTPQLLDLLAPGVGDDPQKAAMATSLTRITFPYLLCITLVTLQSGTLNANGYFAAAAFSPVLLNLVMMACLAVAFLFPDAGVAAAVGITLSGVAQLGLLMWAARRAGVLERLMRPRLDADIKQFFSALVPAVIGSAGVQIALFADTIIASLLPTGGISSIYYADRLYQLPIGVIGIAAGTVLLPEMSRLLSKGETAAAFVAQNRTMALTIALSAPFFVAFLAIPDEVMRGVFLRGRFTEDAVLASASVLAAYGFGLPAVVLINAARASFQATGDTRTPMMVSLIAVAINVAIKIVLYRPLGATGLAFATAVGAWINFGLLAFLALRARRMQPDRALMKIGACVALASLALALVAVVGNGPAERIAGLLPAFRNEAHIAGLGLAGVLVYAAVLLVLLRIAKVRLMRPRRTTPGKSGA